MRKQAEKYCRPFPLYQEANGCGRLFVSIVPSEGEELILQLQIDPSLQAIQGKVTVVIADWLQSLNAVSVDSNENLLVMQISASIASMRCIVKAFSDQFDVLLAHAFQINFYAYLSARPFMREAYWAARGSHITSVNIQAELDKWMKCTEESDQGDAESQASRSRSDSPNGVIEALDCLRQRCWEPWQNGQKVAVPSEVDQTGYFWHPEYKADNNQVDDEEASRHQSLASH